MPDELINMFHDGTAWNNDEVDVIDNNWLEIFINVRNGEGWDWTGWSDVVDCEGYPEDEVKTYMLNYLAEYIEEIQRQEHDAI